MRSPATGIETRHDPSEQGMRNRLVSSLFGAPAAPVKVSRYTVLDELGSGGLGVVYAAYDPKLDRRVALKLINPARVSPDNAQRMLREAQAMAQLTHPNVAAVYDTGPHENGTFIAMELVEGVTLSRWTLDENPPWKETRDVLVAAGLGLAAAHQRGLIHRDFKPANVLVDHTGRPRVLDFGLACSVEEVGQNVSATDMSQSLLGDALTKTGVILGTPQYMAPEQFSGRADARSDQWAFCVTVWESLYRQRPFEAEDVPSMQRLVTAGELGAVPSASSVPGWVERVLRRGLSVAPEQRFADMESLLSALQQDKRSRRLQRLGLLAAVVLSAALTGMGMWLTRPEPTEQRRAEVQQLEQDARAAAERGYYIYPPLDDPAAPTAFGSVVALEQMDGPIKDAAFERGQALRHDLALALVALGDRYAEQTGGAAFAADYYASALIFEPEHDRARERSSLTPGELSLLRRKARSAEFSPAELQGAQVLAALSERDEPTRTAKVAALMRTASPAASTSVHLEALLGPKSLARARSKSRKTAAPAVVAKPASTPTADPGQAAATPVVVTTAKSSGKGLSAAAEIKAGNAALARGDDAAAERAFHRALNKNRRSLTALLRLSALYFDRGAHQKALKYARKATSVAPRNAAAHMELGDACFKVHRYDEARKEYERAGKLGHKGARRALERLSQRVGG